MKRKKEGEYEKEMQRLKEKAPGYVLTISAGDYVDRIGKKLSDYDFRSISVASGYCPEYQCYEGCLERMTREGEAIGAEIVVETRLGGESHKYLFLLGTVLIPKTK
jgi:hypothetical protein